MVLELGGQGLCEYRAGKGPWPALEFTEKKPPTFILLVLEVSGEPGSPWLRLAVWEQGPEGHSKLSLGRSQKVLLLSSDNIVGQGPY